MASGEIKNYAMNYNTFEAAVDITSYTSTEYVAPNDGYVVIGTNTSSTIGIRVYSASNNNYFSSYSVNGNTIPCFVKRGMRIRVTDMAGNSYYARYYKLV